ncbi:MAG: hypothetical protein IT379_23580 [Deltaproteobacteria bacterium]|nr:hypothetical protein [Deltaproteobacteria bacterium]
MPISLHAGWDFARIGGFSLTFTDVGGAAVISLSSGKYSHAGMGAGYTQFGPALETLLDIHPTLTGNFSVSFNPLTSRYTISSTHTFSLTGTGAGSTTAARILGLTGDTGSSASHASGRDVWYSLASASEGLTNDSNVHEPDGVARDAVANDGTHYGVSVVTAAKQRDFVLAFNAKARTFKASETATQPYSLERLMEHCRTSNPFGVYDSTLGLGFGHTHFLRAGGASFRPIRRISNNDLFWDWPFQTRQIGTF